MKFFTNESITPPGGWWYIHPESGREIRGGSFSILSNRTKQFIQANNYPLAQGWKQLIAEQICERVPEFCGETEPATISEKMRQFGIHLKRWLRSGFKTVPEDVFAIRLAACEECPMYSGDSGFGFVACGKCGCSKMKLFDAGSECPLNPQKWGKYHG